MKSDPFLQALKGARVDKLAYLLPGLPPVIERNAVERFLGGLVAPSTLKKWDSQGVGPRFAMRAGPKKVLYDTPFLLECIEKNLEITRRSEHA